MKMKNNGCFMQFQIKTKEKNKKRKNKTKMVNHDACWFVVVVVVCGCMVLSLLSELFCSCFSNRIM
jgi:hypothetical protein